MGQEHDVDIVLREISRRLIGRLPRERAKRPLAPTSPEQVPPPHPRSTLAAPSPHPLCRWHRAMHEFPVLYKWVHKHHHQQTYPDRAALDTFNTGCIESQARRLRTPYSVLRTPHSALRAVGRGGPA